MLLPSRNHRWRYAWSGARIGVSVGFLILVGIFFWIAKSPNGVEGEGLGALFELLGTPVTMVLGAVIQLFALVFRALGLSPQWLGWVSSPLLYLAIIANWGLFGFLIGLVVGRVRQLSIRHMGESQGTEESNPNV